MGAFDKNFRNMAEYILALPAEKKKYIVTNAGGRMIDNGLPVSAQPIVFLTHNKAENVVFLEDNTKIELGHKNVIILMRHDDALIKKIESKISQTVKETIDIYPGTQSAFTVIHIP